jgi:hypothetical protein
MKIRNFMASLLPSFGRDQILEDVRITRTEIKEITKPAYDQAVLLFKSWKFKNKDIDVLMAQFARLVKGSGHGNAISRIQGMWATVLQNLEDMEELAKKTLNEEVAAAGLTYQKANIIQFIEATAFVSKFARKFLVYVYVAETAEFPDSGTEMADSMTPAEVEWLNANFVSFCTAVNVVNGNPGQVKKQLSDIPDILVTDDNMDTLSATMGEHRMDPFQMRLIPVWMNPVYHVGMAVAEWQASRYHAARDEKRLLELRKLNLEKLTHGKPDAHVQKEISHVESRLQGLNYKLTKMEQANA